MKRLILLRHAKSSWDDPSLTDAERPLNQRGERDAPRMAERLRARGARPQLVLSSHARRALATARLVAAALALPPEALHIEPALYLASPDQVLRALATHGGDRTEVMVVGHNPGLTDLVNRLLPELRLANLPTAGVVAMDVDADGWGSMPTGIGLVYYDFPKNRESVSGRAV